MRRVFRPLLLALLALGACTSGDDDGASSIAARSGSLGVLEIERAAADVTAELEERDPTGTELADAESRAVLGAVFARYEGVEGRHVLELLGVGRAAVAPDACVLVGTEDAPLPDPRAAVDLLDAGLIDVRVDGESARLAARTFPELGSLVAGVFYAENVSLPVALPDLDEYHVSASGSDDVAPFEVVVVAPAEPSSVLVGGAAEIERGREAEVLWDAGDPRDRIDLQLTAGGQLVECVARDDGVFHIPASVTSRVDADVEARLVLRRVRSQSFDAEGIDVGRLDIATSRTVEVIVR